MASARSVSADAWWGEGYRKPEWVLSHGGTIVYFEMENISGESDEYKAVMYDSDGKYIEVEYGTKGVFDDAKNGVYKIKADRGVENEETYKGGRSFAVIEIIAHPGETIRLKFDYKKRKVKMTTNYVKPVSSPIIKTIPDSVPNSSNAIKLEDESVETQQQIETSQLSDFQIEELTVETGSEESIIESVENFIHPDALAMETDKQIVIMKEENTGNIFTKLWSIIREFFNFKK